MKIIISEEWRKLLEKELEKEYFQSMLSFLEAEKANGKVIFPHEDNIFAAFNFCSFSALRVVILGQDPYHQEGQADGLAFSVPEQEKIPPSLRNIFKEMNADIGVPIPENGNLKQWATQGVLLLNMHLTVEKGKPLSHKKIGWKIFVTEILKMISDKKEHVIFVLWGKEAQKLGTFIDEEKHYKIQSAHPSPLGAWNGFWNSKPFSKINYFLEQTGQKKIDWAIK